MESYDKIIKKALKGDKEALEKIIKSIKDKVFNLALRMLWNPFDAEDAAQEILIKIITHLNTFKGKSKFTTWVYRVASNYLLNQKKKGVEKQNMSFDLFAMEINEGLKHNIEKQDYGIDRNILVHEAKIACTHAMLLCLNRKLRLVFILSSIFNINSNEGSIILDITPEAFRKRLSRATSSLNNFMEKNCGLINPESKCKCNKKIESSVKSKRLDPEHLLFSKYSISKEKQEKIINEVDEMDKLYTVYKNNPYFKTPDKVLNEIKDVFNSQKYSILEHD